MSFDKDEFRRRAVAAAKRKLQEKKMRENEALGISSKPAEKDYIESPLSREELKVVEAYRKWKKSSRVQEEADVDTGADDGASVPAENMTESKEQRIARLQKKLERRKRVEELKTKLAEKRNAEKPDSIRKQATILKERLQVVRTKLNAMKEEGEMPGAPLAPPAGAATSPTGAALPGQDGMPGAIPNLPPEITAEIQNIATAAQSLAQMAGVAPAAPQPGADLSAGIPPETAGGAGSGMLPETTPGALPESKQQRIARIKKILEQKKAAKAMKEGAGDNTCPTCHCEPCECDENDKMIEQARARAKARREALQSIRQKTMQEKSYDAENQAESDVDTYIHTAMDSGGALGDKGYEFVHQNALQKAGVKHDGASPSMPGRKEATSSISPAKVWPAKDLQYGGKVPEKMPATPDVNPIRKGSGQPMKGAGMNNYGSVTESTEEAWDDKAVNHYLERKELDFKRLLEEGRLG